MPVTALDPKTALIVVDLQKSVLGFPTVHPVSDVVKTASALAVAFRRRRLPVILVNVAGGASGRAEQSFAAPEPWPAEWTEFLPEIDKQPEDHVVTKYTWGAFRNTDLEDHLKKLGVTQVVIVGLATSIGVESTARQAHECGLNVTIAIDAVTDMNADAHVNSLARIFPMLAETGTTQNILNLLNQSHPKK